VATVHFISGLPRSGSTLLSAILRQNPRFSAAMTSPVGLLWSSALPHMSGSAEFATFFDDERRVRVLRGLFNAYHDASSADSVVFDSNRRWTARLALLQQVFPGSKIICCVRDIGWIIDSLERALNKSPTQVSKLINEKGGKTVYSRVDGYMEPEAGIIGFAWSALREAWFGEFAKSLIIVPYERLASDPRAVVAALYDLLGEPAFGHSFDNLQYTEEAYDVQLGMPGLHTVKPRVALEARQPTIPPDLFHKYDDTSFWKNPKLNTRGVQIL
jgi:sulfotransferase